jgi:outer membrane protein assembly factor BamB
MNSPICVSNICVTNRKQTDSFSIAGLMLAIMPLWLMLAAANTSQAQTTSSPADWTQFLRDNMQRYNPYETVLGVNNVDGLKLKWTFTNVQPNVGGNADASPVVANGVVYIGSPDNEGIVFALDASTGQKLWSYGAGDGVAPSVAVANGMVYVGSFDSNVYALNASTGALVWIYAADGVIQSSPAVANGVVYVGTQPTNTFAGTVYALNASTGAKLWSHTAEGPILSSAAVTNGVVYISDGGLTVPSGMDGHGHLYALNASTGAKLWSYTAEGPGISSAAVANGVVYVTSYVSNVSGHVYALNASTGAQLWSFEADGPVVSSPAVANGVVYILSYAGTVYALNASTGAELWSYAPESSRNGFGSSPAVANGVVYLEGRDATLYALNAATGAKLWSSPELNINNGNSSPAVVDGVVYAVSYGSVLAFGLETSGTADLFLRIRPTPETVQQGDLLTYAFPVWNLGPGNAVHEVLTTQVPEGTTLDYVRISGTPGLGTCTTPPYQGTGEIVCHENSAMAPNTTWTVRVVVKVTAPSGTVITESATTTEETPDPNLANNTATVSTTVQ